MTSYKPCVNINCQKLGVIGDIHGDYETLVKALDKLKNCDKIVLLGDYIDRGPNSEECAKKVIELSTKYPNKYIALQGNHEQNDLNKFSIMPIACLCKIGDKNIFLSHAGLPRWYDTESNMESIKNLYDRLILGLNNSEITPLYNSLNHIVMRHDNYSDKLPIDIFMNMYYEQLLDAKDNYDNQTEILNKYKKSEQELAEIYDKTAEMLNEIKINYNTKRDPNKIANIVELINKLNIYKNPDKLAIYNKLYMAKQNAENNLNKIIKIYNQIVMYTTWSDLYIEDKRIDCSDRGIIDGLELPITMKEQMDYANINLFIRGHQLTNNHFLEYDIDTGLISDTIRQISYTKYDRKCLTLHTTTCYKNIIKANPKILIVTNDEIFIEDII